MVLTYRMKIIKPYLECMALQGMTMFPLFSKKERKCAGSWLENTRMFHKSRNGVIIVIKFILNSARICVNVVWYKTEISK